MNAQDFDRWLLASDRRPLVMGILNLTPDSFSDGGQFGSVDAAVARVETMVAEGADWIDIGGESTRPGSARVAPQEQIRRVISLLKSLRNRTRAILSIDTSSATVAEAALDEGVEIVNDISAGKDDPALFPLVACRRKPLILMHMQGEPATMQIAPHYQDVIQEVRLFLSQRRDAAVAAGIERSRILLDPGIGFGKTLTHNLTLLRALPEIKSLGNPLVLGASRKKFITTVTGEQDPARIFGTAATVAWGIANGTDVVRVHDVAAMSQVVRMVGAIQNGKL